MDEELDRKPDAQGIPPNAMLLMENGKSFPLDQAVITIGRMLNNNLVIDDPRVSRHHAQLRAVDGHFVLSDTNSTGGVFVNGRRIAQAVVIYPNDSISLAGVILTFHQDEPPLRPDLAETMPP